MPWYKTGTATVTLSSATVTGAGTAWVDNTRIGDAFIGPDGLVYEITARASNTSLTIAPPYKSATGSARPYVIAPMQGYVKTLADQAQLLLNSTEPIVPAGTTAQYYRGDKTWQAMASMPVSAATTAALATKADASATTAAIAARYGKNNVLGTVSQSAGVPTGAIIEYGSNANGEYWRYAGGMQICTHTVTTVGAASPSGALFTSVSTPWTYPAAFVALSTPYTSASESGGNGLSWGGLGLAVTNDVTTSFALFRSTAAAVPSAVALLAVGRWFNP